LVMMMVMMMIRTGKMHPFLTNATPVHVGIRGTLMGLHDNPRTGLGLGLHQVIALRWLQ